MVLGSSRPLCGTTEQKEHKAASLYIMIGYSTRSAVRYAALTKLQVGYSKVSSYFCPTYLLPKVHLYCL